LSRKLSIAKGQLADGKSEVLKPGREQAGRKLIEFARKRMLAAIADFPDAPAAAEARRLLDDTEKFLQDLK
jgi:hypothetical protein